MSSSSKSPPSLQITYPPSAAFDRLLTRNFNTVPLNRQPAAITEPRTASDVQSAVLLAIEHDWRVSVRSGGHSWACWGVRDDALLIDLAELRTIEMVTKDDLAIMGMAGKEGEIVAVSPAVTGKELNEFLATRDRMFPGGHCPDVGLGGFLLQGGMGWNAKISPTFDPDTEIVLVSAYPRDDPTASSPNLVALFTTFKPTTSAASAALSPSQLSRPPNFLAEIPFAPTSFQQEYAAQTCASPAGYRYAVDNAYLRNDCDVSTVLEKAFTHLPTRDSYALYFSMVPTSQRPLEDMALSLQSDHYVAVYATWKSENDDARCKGWVKEMMQGIEKDSVGSYLGDADFRVRKTRFWGVEQGKRLREVREKWDAGGRICGFLGAESRDGNEREELENRLEWL